MSFFDPPPPKVKHKCHLPEPSILRPRGWRCKCGKAYVLYTESQHGETWYQWRRAPELDERVDEDAS